MTQPLKLRQVYKKGASAPLALTTTLPLPLPLHHETHFQGNPQQNRFFARYRPLVAPNRSATVDRVRANIRPDMQKNQGGRPAKLTASDKRRLVRMITSGKADNPVQVAQELKNSIEVEVSAQTVRRALKEAGMKAMVKKRSPDFCQDTSASASTLHYCTSAGPSMTGSASFGPTRPRSIGWAPMGASGCGKN